MFCYDAIKFGVSDIGCEKLMMPCSDVGVASYKWRVIHHGRFFFAVPRCHMMMLRCGTVVVESRPIQRILVSLDV